MENKRYNKLSWNSLSQLPDHVAAKMPRCIQMRLRIESYLRPMQSIRFFLLITCISLTLSVIWIQLVENKKSTLINQSLIHEVMQNVARDYRYAQVYRKADKLPSDVKYVLLWTRYDFAPFYYFGHGQRKFIDKNCTAINCYITTEKNYFNGNTTKFDVIAFNGRNIAHYTKLDLPKKRSPHQKFIYFNMESADNEPICNDIFDNFFNLTSTYRLDSDIPIPYIQIRNSEGDVIGPKSQMNWIKSGATYDENLEMRLQNKTKAVAWFVSNCKSRNSRKDYVNKLQKALSSYSLQIDIYGKCGPLKCPRSQHNCSSILERDYFFYLSFENSFSDDYVTEKLLTALQHEVVPIVFGGADYSRFLPPGSYLNARNTTPTELATTIAGLMKSIKSYSRFFSWKSYYTYHDPYRRDNICAFCAALNDESLDKRKSYRHFRSWWLPNFGDRCR